MRRRGVSKRAWSRASITAVLVLAASWATAAPASAQFEFERFATHGDARAGWSEEASAPVGSADQQSIDLFVSGSSPQDFDDAARVLFRGFGSSLPSAAPSFEYYSSNTGFSGGSPRLVVRFSDGAQAHLLPVTLQAGQWTRVDGATTSWDSFGGACGPRVEGLSYAALLACHLGASVTGVEIVNDSGWFYRGGFQLLVDNVTYDGVTVSAAPPPALGESLSLVQVGGNVLVDPPGPAGGQGLASQAPEDPLAVRGETPIPVGSLVDARRGRVQLIAARDRRGRKQSGNFSKGIFQVVQSKRRAARGLTTLRLKGSMGRRCRRGSSSDASASGRAPVRRLSARARGRFRTRGRNASAIVRGTRWTIADRCDGTKIWVRQGKVEVRDHRRGRTLLVRAGQSYLAR